MYAFLVSAGIVAVAEIGDKTQLLAILLAARYRTPLPIILGILCATLLNHMAASAIGVAIAAWLKPETLRWVLAVSFLAMAVWALIPDKEDARSAEKQSRWGVFGITLVSFFLVEIGDKTQIATSMLAARFDTIIPVALGTTLGMMIADVPAVYLGDIAAKKLPLKWMRMIAAIIFAGFGVALILGVGS